MHKMIEMVLKLSSSITQDLPARNSRKKKKKKKQFSLQSGNSMTVAFSVTKSRLTSPGQDDPLLN